MDSHIDRQLDAALQAKWVARQQWLRALLKKSCPPPETPGMPPHRNRGFTPEQFTIIRILQTLGHRVTVSAIAEAVDLPHANVTRTLDRLEKKGVIHRMRGDEDKRQVMVRLTLEGSKAAKKLNDIEKRLDEIIWANYSSQEKLILLDLLGRQS